MAKQIVTQSCTKCGRQLRAPAFEPAYCDKCELIDALLVERYTHYERPEEPDNG